MAGESQQLPETAPDPSVLTTDSILRATAAERDYVDGQMAVLEQRLAGIDEATRVLSETINRTPTEIQREVLHLRELSEEEFVSIGTRFQERDTAVSAALAAQKEAAFKQDEANQKAIDKAEKASIASMEKLAEILKTTTNALSVQIVDLKERVDRTEGKAGGVTASMGVMLSVAALVVAIVSVLVNILTN